MRLALGLGISLLAGVAIIGALPLLTRTPSATADLQPVQWTLTGFANPLNLETATSRATRIIEGTAVRAGPPLWTTSNGTRQGMTVDELREGDFRIVTPYEITPSKVWKGRDGREPFTAYQLGGTIGDDALTVEPAAVPLKDGRSGIYFAFPADDYFGALEGVWEVPFAVAEPVGETRDLYSATPAELDAARRFLDETFASQP